MTTLAILLIRVRVLGVTASSWPERLTGYDVPSSGEASVTCEDVPGDADADLLVRPFGQRPEVVDARGRLPRYLHAGARHHARERRATDHPAGPQLDVLGPAMGNR